MNLKSTNRLRGLMQRHVQMPRLNSTLPSLPALSQNSSSKCLTSIACRCGKTASASGSANIEVPKMSAREAIEWSEGKVTTAAERARLEERLGELKELEEPAERPLLPVAALVQRELAEVQWQRAHRSTGELRGARLRRGKESQLRAGRDSLVSRVLQISVQVIAP